MSDWFTDSLREQWDRQAEILGRFTLAIFGKTGVGKSTLLNAVFGSPVAATGIGEPVTRDSHLYLDRRGQLGVVDTQGLEIGRDDKAIRADLDKMVKEMRRKPVGEQVHVAWYCVRGMDRRFESSEAEFVRHLASLGVPVIMVFTQVPRNAEGGYHPDAVALARHVQSLELPIAGGRPFLTNAMRDQFTGQPEHGLIDLLEATFRAAPEAVHGALTASQRIDLAAKSREAQKVIGTAAAGAAAAAATPIPFSDAAMLVPLQLGMMARIAQLFTVRFDRASMMAIASTSAATAGGRAAFTNLLKLVPGAGTMAGGAISAAVASAFTLAMGQAWVVVCTRAASGQLDQVGGVLDNEHVRRVFTEEFRKRMPGVRRSPTD